MHEYMFKNILLKNNKKKPSDTHLTAFFSKKLFLSFEFIAQSILPNVLQSGLSLRLLTCRWQAKQGR